MTSLEFGDTVTAADLKLPAGAVFNGEPDVLILSIAASPSQASLDAELAEGGNEAEAAHEA